MTTLVLSLSGGSVNASPNGSLGGERSSTTITTDILQNILDNITRNEALVGRTEYRCIYVYNSSGTETSVTIESTGHPTLTNIAIGLDPAGKGNGTTNGVATIIASESIVPTGVKFFGVESDGSYAGKLILPIGVLKAGESVAVWLKRQTETGPQSTITFNLVLQYNQNITAGHSVDDGGAIGEIIDVDVVPTGGYVIGTARVGFSDLG